MRLKRRLVTAVVAYLLLVSLNIASFGQVYAEDHDQFTLDIDGDGFYTPLGDGLLIIRYMFSFPGEALTKGAVASNATRSSTTNVTSYLVNAGTALDVDGNGSVEPLADGLLIIRYLFSFPDASLINGAIGVGAGRTTASEIKAYIESLMPNISSEAVSNGTVIDGYIAGATVFVDANNNGFADPTEIQTVTDAKGRYTINSRDAVTATGGFDISTNSPFEGLLTAPAGATVVTPLTSLIKAKMDNNPALTSSTANLKVVNNLGLPIITDLTTLDHYKNNDSTVFKANAIVGQVMKEGTALLKSSVSGQVTNSKETALLFSQFSNSMATVLNSPEQASILGNVITNASSNITNDLSTLISATVKQTVADIGSGTAPPAKALASGSTVGANFKISMQNNTAAMQANLGVMSELLAPKVANVVSTIETNKADFTHKNVDQEIQKQDYVTRELETTYRAVSASVTDITKTDTIVNLKGNIIHFIDAGNQGTGITSTQQTSLNNAIADTIDEDVSDPNGVASYLGSALYTTAVTLLDQITGSCGSTTWQRLAISESNCYSSSFRTPIKWCIYAPPGYVLVRFTTGCEAHDKCFDSKLANKKDCDEEFYEKLLKLCAGERSFKYCQIDALGFAKAVEYFGTSAFCDAQRKMQEDSAPEITMTEETIKLCGHHPPSISSIDDQSTSVNTATSVFSFFIVDEDTALANLKVSGSSSNKELIPDGNIIFYEEFIESSLRTMSITPATGQSGSATITVTVSDGILSASTTFTVTVSNQEPTASFTISPSSGDTGTNFQFDASGSTDPEDSSGTLQVRWDWDGDSNWDTSYSTTKAVVHTFSSADTYSVKLMVKDSGGLTHTATHSVTVTTVAPPSVGGMTFKPLPSGTFTMGSPSTETGRYSNEGPQHSVTISKSFYMQTTEVTQGQWRAVMGSNPSYFSSCGDTCPVENVSWDDIQTFLSALNAKGQGSYRLPTEAEWEYAARAGTTTAYSFGNSSSSLGDYAWYSSNSSSKTHPVGQKLPNAWGLYDMHGNVWEWVSDWYGGYSSSAATDPVGSTGGSFRVRRGGSWGGVTGDLRSAHRAGRNPGNRSNVFGFRLVAASPGP